MVNAARKAGVINMVNFSYRDWPCIQAVAAPVRRGDLGEMRHVEASYLQSWLPSKLGRLADDADLAVAAIYGPRQ